MSSHRRSTAHLAAAAALCAAALPSSAGALNLADAVERGMVRPDGSPRGLGSLGGSTFNHPQLNNTIAEIVERLVARMNSAYRKNIVVAPYTFYHHVSYPQAGSTAQFTFFNLARTPFRTNWFGPSGAPSDYGIVLYGVSAMFLPYYDVSGATNAYDATSAQVCIGNRTAYENNEAQRRIMNDGEWVLRINGKEIFTVFGTGTLPSGQGAEISGTATSNITAGAAVEGSVLATGNGAPNTANLYRFDPPMVIFPGERVEGQAQFPALIPFANPTAGGTADGTLSMRLHCAQVTFRS